MQNFISFYVLNTKTYCQVITLDNDRVTDHFGRWGLYNLATESAARRSHSTHSQVFSFIVFSVLGGWMISSVSSDVLPMTINILCSEFFIFFVAMFWAKTVKTFGPLFRFLGTILAFCCRHKFPNSPILHSFQ